MITGLNESKKLTKHISRKYGCKFDCRECNKGSSEITINVGVSAKTQKKIMHAKKNIFGILLHVLVRMATLREVLLTIQ